VTVQQLLYRLPTGLQLQLKALKRRVLGTYDWADPVRVTRLREQANIDAITHQHAREPGRRRIAIYSLHHWSPVEYGLAKALALRGHDVRGILCDGLLPLCELNLGPKVRPPCPVCIGAFSRHEDAFGFQYARLSQYVTPDDLQRAEVLVRDTPDAALPALRVDDVPVGVFARRELQRYYRGFIFDPSRDPAYRRWLVSGVLYAWMAQRWLDDVQPEILGVCSGRTLNTACVYDVARRRGIRVVTWDGAATHPDTLMFSHDRPATEIPLDDLWATERDRALSTEEDARLTTHLELWSRSKNTPFPYNTNPVSGADAIRAELELRPNAPLVAVYTNTSWDIAVIDRDVGFESMFDWLFALVRYAQRHPEIDLVVRAHPAEKKVPPALQSRSPVGPEIRKRFQPLPPNVRIIEGDNPISSYTLAEMASVNVVYSTRFGHELALRGIRPWIAGAVTYRGKGFTLDIESVDHMERLLDTGTFDTRMSETEVELARRFAYLWFFRYEAHLPLLLPADRRFTLTSFAQLAPGGDPAIDRLCDAFVTGAPFVDIGTR
jgi:hypothetical protein